MTEQITIIGAGMAGCEAAWVLANAGFAVNLYEMKPHRYSPAHHSPDFAELVCSNSLKASRVDSAAGLLKEEMRRLGSLLVPCAEQCAVEAGGALAVDRHTFSALVTKRIRSHPRITVIEQEVDAIPEGNVIIATGPLTSDALHQPIAALTGASLYFYDAAAPIITGESVCMDHAFYASRYGKGGDDYLNCPMNQEEYLAFYEALVDAETAPLHAFEQEQLRVYEGCMPVEVLAKRGQDSIRYGMMKPVGLTDPHTGRRPYAVVQLRRENREGTLWNLVGFQTNLKFGEQKRVFSMIPALRNAEFVRYGVMHRNSFLNSPKLLDAGFALKQEPRIRFAGQMTGVEGYMESAGSGLLAAWNLLRALRGQSPLILPCETMLGALVAYITDPYQENLQPMGANMGLLPALTERYRDKQKKYQAYAERALAALEMALAASDMTVEAETLARKSAAF
ncbi:MAG: methylenetetrahydrofolate--tRNA-(uracil(54)-C(5))-methyltransferase (FADH(2)-oxidizing) TrmFO [Oscillospiraceae bacterium]|nr:methylenetetrahydrofolate--tRNA-(uracil(54)-C(5))-methyltransferase (FADH(2)-oxidizing) TrmFO [Oscillospiraceae bacterium]